MSKRLFLTQGFSPFFFAWLFSKFYSFKSFNNAFHFTYVFNKSAKKTNKYARKHLEITLFEYSWYWTCLILNYISSFVYQISIWILHRSHLQSLNHPFYGKCQSMERLIYILNFPSTHLNIYSPLGITGLKICPHLTIWWDRQINDQ